MNTYKISKGSWSEYKNFESLEAAQSYASGLGQGYTVALSDEKIEDEDASARVQSQFDFGISLIKLFRVDNAQYEKDNDTIITPSETFDLMSKFGSVISLCQVGAIKEVASLLTSLEPDDIFTQERKDKYQTLINNYLGV